MLFFLGCAVFGAVLLVLQLVVGFAGGDSHLGDALHVHDGAEHGSAAKEGLDLLSVRALCAGVAFFGLAGAFAESRGLGLVPAVVVGLAAGGAAATGVAALTRQLLRFESDGAPQLGNALGATATVYVPVPASRGGAGKVQLTLQGRVVECVAVTGDERPLATGAPVLVIDVDGETLVVAADPAAAGAR